MKLENQTRSHSLLGDSGREAIFDEIQEKILGHVFFSSVWDAKKVIYMCIFLIVAKYT